MASVSLFNLSAGTTLASGDILVFCDISDTTQSANGSDLKITLTNFFAGIPVPVNVTSASASALAVGRLGATTPAFTVDASTASQVAGLKVTGAATGGTVAVVATDSGAATNLTVNAKGTGTIGIGTVSTGLTTIGTALAVTGAATLASTLGVTGATTLAGLSATTGAFSGAVTAATTLGVTGATTLAALSATTGTFSSTLGVTGAATLSSTLTIGGLTYTFPASQTANRFLKTDGAGTLSWATILEQIALTDLSDVTITSQATGQILRASSASAWANSTATFPDTATAGHLLYASASNVWSGLTIGAANTVLLSTGSAPSWVAQSTLTAPAGLLTGTTLASNVVTSSLTAIGTLASGAVPASLVTAGTFGSGSFTFPGALAITGALTGVTTLTTSGAINGQTISSAASFTGTLGVTGATTLSSTLTIGGLTYTFPASQSANRYLKTDGSGALSWASILETIALTDLSDVTITSQATGQILRASSASAWANSTATFPDTATAGHLLYASASNVWSGLTIGAANTVLLSTGSAPSWVAQSTLTAPAGLLTGTTLASNVVTSSLTAIGTLASGAVPASLVTAGTFGSGSYTFPGALAITGALTGVTTLTTSGAINGQTISSAASLTGTLAVTGAVTLSSSLTINRADGNYLGVFSNDGGGNNEYLSLYKSSTAFVLSANKNGSGTRRAIGIGLTGDDSVATTKELYITSGAATFSGTLAVTGAVTCTVGNNAPVLVGQGATTGYMFANFTNTSGQLRWAVEGSSGGSLVSGSSAYASLLGSTGATSLQLFTSNTTRLTIDSAGAVRFNAYGAGTATFDASGNITSVSDERHKTDILPFTAGLTALRGIAPITHKYNADSGLETEHTYIGFSAQNVLEHIPGAVFAREDGILSLWDRGILAATVNAVQTLDQRVTALEAQ